MTMDAEDDNTDLSPEDREALLRWRLALGPGAEQVSPRFRLNTLCQGGAGQSLDGDDSERRGAARAGELAQELDRALSFVYDEGSARAGLGPSRPYIPRWLASLRAFFSHEVVALVQKDAIERRGLTQLLLQPETLPYLERNVELVATLASAKGLIPEQAQDLARRIVREVVEDLRRKLEEQVRTAVSGALRRNRRSPLQSARNFDWRRTIRENLKGWDPERRRLCPERLHFFANQRRHNEWDVAILVDQSGSMAESVVYSSVMAAIFASLGTLRTRMCFFDTEIVDVSDQLDDPVELIFRAQLGGGTDINRAVAYAQRHFIERPERTLFLLISDLCEGGDASSLVARMRQIHESKVRALCLLALTDSGAPVYDHAMAEQLTEIGIPCFGCTPRLLTQAMERILRGQDLGPLVHERPR